MRVFEWTDGFYGTVNGEAIVGPCLTLGVAVLACEAKGFRKMRHRPPPPSWFRGTAGPNKAPQPIRKALKVGAKVATTVAAAAVGKPGVSAIAGSVAKVATHLSKMTVSRVKHELGTVNNEKVLDALLLLESNGRNRKGVKDAVGVRRRAMRG